MMISELYDEKIAIDFPIQYGGSVNEKNIGELMAKEHINGVLVGGASLDPVQFSDIIRGA